MEIVEVMGFEDGGGAYAGVEDDRGGDDGVGDSSGGDGDRGIGGEATRGIRGGVVEGPTSSPSLGAWAISLKANPPRTLESC